MTMLLLILSGLFNELLVPRPFLTLAVYYSVLELLCIESTLGDLKESNFGEEAD